MRYYHDIQVITDKLKYTKLIKKLEQISARENHGDNIAQFIYPTNQLTKNSEINFSIIFIKVIFLVLTLLTENVYKDQEG